jgi:hypothetical protein
VVGLPAVNSRLGALVKLFISRYLAAKLALISDEPPLRERRLA